MADVSNLYPAPPQQQQNALAGNPLGVIDMVSKLNQNALFQQEFNAKKAIGHAYQKAINPQTGVIDTPTLMREIQANPDAGFLAGEASAGALSRQGQAISNATSAFTLAQNQNNYLRDTFGSLANKPNLTREDLYNAVVMIGRNTNVPTSTLTNYIRSVPNDPKALRDFALSMQAQAVGASGTAARVAGPPAQSGAPTTVPAGAAIFGQPNGQGGQSGPPAMSGSITTEPAPGFTEAKTALAQSGAEAANRLREANDTSPQRKGMLGNLEEDLQHFTSGPGADWTKVAKSWVNRNVPLPKDWQFDPKSIASQEQFTKQATQLVQAQFQSIGGTGTDAKFNSAYETSPNDTLSQLGNQGIIRLLKGNEDAIQAKNKAWLGWKKNNGPDTYDEFSQDFNTRFDPRVFQFKYIPKSEREAYISRMDPQDRARFVQDLVSAHKQGWVNYGGMAK
jgi:hypothetical protein